MTEACTTTAAGFLSFSTVAVLSLMTFFVVGAINCCKMVGYLEASLTSSHLIVVAIPFYSLVLATKKVSRHCQISPWGQNYSFQL